MSSVLLVALLGLHGLLHGLGAAKAFGWLELPQMTRRPSRAEGVLWVVLGVLLFVAAGARIAGLGNWWMWGTCAVVLSQGLVFRAWSDAKFGSIPNLLLCFWLATGFGEWRFSEATSSAHSQLMAGLSAAPRRVVEPNDLRELPAPVRGWLEASGLVGLRRARNVRIEQRGELRTEPEANWFSFRATQWATVPRPGFLWSAEVDSGYGTTLRGRDLYLLGFGSMRIELMSLVPIVDAHGDKIDQGALVRFLAEIIWYPEAALEPYLRWQPIDERSARVDIEHGGARASGVFRFDSQQRVIEFEAKRYRESSLEDWLVRIDPESVRSLGGVSVPTRAEVSWLDPSGKPFTWLKLQVESIARAQ